MNTKFKIFFHIVLFAVFIFSSLNLINVSASHSECDDLIDNDSDGLIDFGTNPTVNDPDCADIDDDDESYTFSVPNPLGVTSITDLIQRIINALIILSIPIASILIIYAGVLYMVSAGTDKVKKATSALIWTIVGFGLLLISSGVIDVVKNILGVKTTPGTGTTPPIVSGGPKTFQDILDIFIDLANKFFTFAIIIASVMIIVSGISFMTAGSDANRAATSRKMLIYAIIGVAIAILSTFIIAIVKNYLLS